MELLGWLVIIFCIGSVITVFYVAWKMHKDNFFDNDL
jgi:hypothetical protein